MSDDIVKRLREEGTNWRVGLCVFDAADEITRLRAELAAERERNKWSTAEVATAQAYQANQRADKAEAERDALRALLRDAQEAIGLWRGHPKPDLLARIDAALNKGDGDE